MAQALYEQEKAPSLNTAITVGAGGGALAGMMAGIPVHQAGRAFNKLTGRAENRFKPGNRMAGALVGAALGGALGGAIQQQTKQISPAARILAKVQAGGDLTIMEKQQLEYELAKAYSNTINLRGMGMA